MQQLVIVVDLPQKVGSIANLFEALEECWPEAELDPTLTADGWIVHIHSRLRVQEPVVSGPVKMVPGQTEWTPEMIQEVLDENDEALAQ